MVAIGRFGNWDHRSFHAIHRSLCSSVHQTHRYNAEVPYTQYNERPFLSKIGFSSCLQERFPLVDFLLLLVLFSDSAWHQSPNKKQMVFQLNPSLINGFILLCPLQKNNFHDYFPVCYIFA